MAIAYAISVGVGYHRFGNVDQARAHLQRALAMAQEHGINQYLFEAEEALLQLDVPAAARSVSATVPIDLQEVAGAIREMKEAAGVA
jgi:uncharacterized protein HemY